MPSRSKKIAKVHDIYVAFFDALNDDIKAAWPEITSDNLYHGRPRQQTLAPACAILLDEVSQEHSGVNGSKQNWTVTIAGAFERPAATNIPMLSVMLDKADDLIAKLEVRKVWPQGGVLGLVESVQVIEEDEAGEIGVLIRFSVQYYCQKVT